MSQKKSNTHSQEELDNFDKTRRELDEALGYTNNENDPRARTSDKHLRYLDSLGDLNKERAKDPEWLKRATERNQKNYGAPVEVCMPSGEYKNYKGMSEAARDLDWKTLHSVNHEKNFPKDGSWRAHGNQRKGYYTRRIIKGKARPPLPKEFSHGNSSLKPQVKEPGGKWITYNGCQEASEKLGWKVLASDTKKYFPADGSIYTQRLGVKKGWSTRRKLDG